MTNAASPAHTYTHTHTHTHTCTPTFCHSRWQTRSHSHPLSNFPCVSAVSSLQCDSPLSPLDTLRIIEYRSLAFAAVCKRVCVCLTTALQGHRHGNLSMGVLSLRCHRPQVTGVTWNGGQEGGPWGGGARGGWWALQCCGLQAERRGARSIWTVLLHCVFRPEQNNEEMYKLSAEGHWVQCNSSQPRVHCSLDWSYTRINEMQKPQGTGHNEEPLHQEGFIALPKCHLNTKTLTLKCKQVNNWFKKKKKVWGIVDLYIWGMTFRSQCCERS